MTAPRSAVLQTRPVTDGLLSMLTTAFTATAHNVYDYDLPNENEMQDWAPDDPRRPNIDRGYLVVYPVPGGGFDGAPLWSPEADGWLAYQITSVSSKRDAVEWIADRVRLTLLSRVDAGGFQVPFPVLAGMKVTQREPDGTPPGVIPEGPPTHRVYNVPEVFRLYAESI